MGVIVVMLGAYVRLSDAGLGCPDWPGCYGQLTVPSVEQEILEANASYPQRPLEVDKAWKEMIHRYLAGFLGLFIVSLSLLAWKFRQLPGQPRLLPALLLLVVAFQGMLGMWTVTLLVKPLIVTIHLLGGLATVTLLWLLSLRLISVSMVFRSLIPHFVEKPVPTQKIKGLFAAILLGVFILVLQIFLGGWTSTNYAAIGCTEFPTCNNGVWWPEMDFSEGFVLWRGLGINYEYGVLDYPARTAIHVTHRIGALVTAVYLTLLGLRLLRSDLPVAVRRVTLLLLGLLMLQLGLGITNVLAKLPLSVAVAHNGGALLLLLTLTTLMWQLWPYVSGKTVFQQAKARSNPVGSNSGE
ncbi:hypothetical protein BGP75_17990 [Motiliproteus sp. MSK22-1]|nr:hypothetical protein BGP75_17990 [Motiliproteus sp. MSK22-1]